MAPRLTVVPDDGADPDVPGASVPATDELTADAAQGAHDAAWFEHLVRTHTRALHRYLVRRVGVGDADDLAADVLVVAWRRRDDVPDEAPLAWLYRTAGFVVANFRRKGRPIPIGAHITARIWFAVTLADIRNRGCSAADARLIVVRVSTAALMISRDTHASTSGGPSSQCASRKSGVAVGFVANSSTYPSRASVMSVISATASAIKGSGSTNVSSSSSRR